MGVVLRGGVFFLRLGGGGVWWIGVVIGWWEEYGDGYNTTMRRLRGTGMVKGCWFTTLCLWTECR